MAKKAGTVTINIIPASGETQTREYTIPAGGATVADALKALDVSPEKKNISIGRPAEAGSNLADGDIVTVQLKAGQQVTVTERPRGS